MSARSFAHCLLDSWEKYTVEENVEWAIEKLHFLVNSCGINNVAEIIIARMKIDDAVAYYHHDRGIVIPLITEDYHSSFAQAYHASIVLRAAVTGAFFCLAQATALKQRL